VGRERELYRAAGRLVATLTWTDVETLGGASVALQARILRGAYERHRSRTIPARLVVGQLQIVPVSRDQVRVVAYNHLDPIDLPRDVLEALVYFDGRPTREALHRIRVERRLNLRPDLVRRLVDFGVLAPVARAGAG
jgi:hypothetical protein